MKAHVGGCGGATQTVYVKPVLKYLEPFPPKEDLLKENPDRFSLFPIKNPAVYEMYKQSLACFWTADEIDMTQDLKDFRAMSKDEQHFVKHVLAFFASADGIVIENLVTTFCTEVQMPEARQFYAFQAAMESIHAESYALMIDTLVDEDGEKQHLFSAINTMPAINKKAAWALKWISSLKPFAERLIAFAIVEGVFFSGAFCSIFWLKKRGLCPGLSFANQMISRDEGLHTDFACLLFRDHIKTKPTRKRILEILLPAVEMECEFVQSSLPVSLIGMNAESMTQYVRFVADRLLVSLGQGKHFNEANPFSWMEMISMQGKTNFFEARVAEYAKSGCMASEAEKAFDMDAEF